MRTTPNFHTFSIPVMGIGYTIDTAIKVAPFGISSVMSLVDDILIEKMREFHSKQFNLPFNPISMKVDDYRAKRITAYLDMVDDIVKSKFEQVKSSFVNTGKDFDKYLNMLPNTSKLKHDFNEFMQNNGALHQVKGWLDQHLNLGSIDVNIMTKLDKVNYKNGVALPQENNDAFAALRGFAQSKVSSSVVFSAGMSPKLYSYMAQFDDFFPNAFGEIKKKIILKVSDLRSAMVQGQMLAKRGLWVSEYRIESGLNCGGHAFATEGLLMGPILEDFKTNYADLQAKNFELLKSALSTQERSVPEETLPLRITAQGGVGTSEEHDFLLSHYGLDSVGWGSPFLLVDEASTIDVDTQNRLATAKEDDLYLSHISPLGVRFNSLRGNTKDLEKQLIMESGQVGSSCPKRYLVSNTEFGDRALCTASRTYLTKKLDELNLKKLPTLEYHKQFEKITEKSCICVGLGTSALIANGLDTKTEGSGVSVCPGPNIAYFDQRVNLETMVGHIYGKLNLIRHTKRPHMFVKELSMYVDYFKEKVSELNHVVNKNEKASLDTFQANLQKGIHYYNDLFNQYKQSFAHIRVDIANDLARLEAELKSIKIPEKWVETSVLVKP